MFKVLLIVLAFFFILFRVGGFFLRLLFGNAQARQNENFQKTRSTHKPKDGNVHVDHIPDHQKGKKDFDGGDYIDYEEVK